MTWWQPTTATQGGTTAWTTSHEDMTWTLEFQEKDRPPHGRGWALYCLPAHLVLTDPGIGHDELTMALRWATQYVNIMIDNASAG